MWVSTIWVLGVLVCSDAGTDAERCTQHVFGPFSKQADCSLNAMFVREAIEDHLPSGTTLTVDAACYAGTPDRET